MVAVTEMPSSWSPGIASRVASVMHCDTAVMAPSYPTALSPWMAAMQKASLPTMYTTPASLEATSCICDVMSAVPGGILMRSYSSPAFSRRAGAAPESNEALAWGTSMLTKAIRSVPSLSAAAIGTPNSVASGFSIVKLVSVSASRPSALVCRNIVGTPAACSGSHTESATADWLRATATTSSSTIWLAQSVAPAGSAPVSQVTTSMGRPATPAWCVFQYSAAAWAPRSSSVLSNAWVAPSDTIPILTGSPDAASSGPSRSVASEPLVASSSSDDDESSSSPPQATTPSSSALSAARAIARRVRLPRRPDDSPGFSICPLLGSGRSVLDICSPCCREIGCRTRSRRGLSG